MKTWQIERGVVTLVLGFVVVVTRGGIVEWLGALAVVLAFGHTQIADRLAEQEAARPAPNVECHGLLVRYLVTKEVAWALYFVLHRSWSALVGVGVFLAYPAWRRWWRRRNPL